MLAWSWMGRAPLQLSLARGSSVEIEELDVSSGTAFIQSLSDDDGPSIIWVIED
jgi:hypothetical protein